MADTNLNPQVEAGSSATPSWKEALSATFDEVAAGTSDGADDSGATDDSPAGADDADPSLLDGGDEGADPGEDSDGVGDDAAGGADESVVWDGKPDTMPDKIKEAIAAGAAEAVRKRESEMSRGVQKLLEQKAEYERQLQFFYAQQQAAQAPAKQQQAGPPAPPADTAGPEEWDQYYDKRTAWATRQTIAELVQSGALLTPDMVQPMREQSEALAVQTEQMGRLQYIARLPGCTDAVMQKMADIAGSDPNLHALMSSNEGAASVFKIAKAQLEYEEKLAGVGGKVEANVRRGAEAGNNAMPRPGGVRKQAETVGRPKESFRSVAERLDYEIREAQKS